MEHEACSGKWRQHSPAFDSLSLLPILVDAIVDFLFSESRQGIKVNWDFLVCESVCTTPFKMATPEIEIHHRFFRNSIYSSFPQFFEEISAILSRGSISFGRYADDSIAWEKRSVFTYNRCEEELQKFQAPGFVAQKTAYFNEFYKRVGVVEALPAHQQNTRQYGPSQETQENSKLRGIGFNDAVAEKEDKPSNASQIQISDSQGISNNMEPCCQEVKNCSTENNDATIEEGMKVYRNTVEVENSFEEASVSHPPLSEGNPKCAQRKSIASSKVKQIFNKTIKHGNKVKDKGTVASAITNKAKVCSITTKVAVMKSKPNPSLRQQASVKVNKSVPSTIESTPNAVRNISRQTTEPHSSLPRLSGLSIIVPSMKQSTPNAVRNISRQTTEPHSRLPRLSRLSKSAPSMKESTQNTERNISRQTIKPHSLPRLSGLSKSVSSTKESTQNAVRDICRQTTEPRSSLPRLSGLSKTVCSMKESTPNAVRNISRQTTERHFSLPRSSKLLISVPSIKESTQNAVRNMSRQTTERHFSLHRLSKLLKSVPSMKESTQNAVRNISRQTTERHSSLPRSSKLLRRVPSMKESTPNAVRNITRQTTKRHSSLPRPSRRSKSVPSMKESTPNSVRNISGQTIEPQAYVDCPDYRKVVAWCHLAPALEKLKPSHVQKEPNKNQSCQCKFPALK
ncbi:hypothetical protein ES319_D13G137300v1 [Gossypium barbadense]|uniref:TPX2 C-terminal domain-containing protein n=1 Tax=Gossypium barbadense TaxID=3634 RepID=A0A5J5NQR9_GOSBA|nr:hypothetical protein ES319_D13G137300v1 [Gossypium barbadense]